MIPQNFKHLSFNSAKFVQKHADMAPASYSIQEL